MEGTLIDARTLNPIEGAVVMVTNAGGSAQTVETDIRGDFRVSGISGPNTFNVRAAGYAGVERTVDGTAHATVYFQLQSPSPTIPCGDGPNVGNRVLAIFSPPFQGSYRLRNYYDHDLPLPFQELGGYHQNGYVINACGARVTNYDGHEGTDYDLPLGTPVVAVADGTVLGAGETQPFYCPALGRMVTGISVEIQHPAIKGEQFSTLYTHLSRIDVRAGQAVVRGQQIGLSGDSGCTPVAHLHFQVFRLTNTNSGRKATIDPYGWEGTGADPWSIHPQGAGSFWLWLPGQAPPLR